MANINQSNPVASAAPTGLPVQQTTIVAAQPASQTTIVYSQPAMYSQPALPQYVMYNNQIGYQTMYNNQLCFMPLPLEQQQQYMQMMQMMAYQQNMMMIAQQQAVAPVVANHIAAPLSLPASQPSQETQLQQPPPAYDAATTICSSLTTTVEQPKAPVQKPVVATAVTTASAATDVISKNNLAERNEAAKKGFSTREEASVDALSRFIEGNHKLLEDKFFVLHMQNDEVCDLESLSKELPGNKHLIVRRIQQPSGKLTNECAITIVSEKIYQQIKGEKSYSFMSSLLSDNKRECLINLDLTTSGGIMDCKFICNFRVCNEKVVAAARDFIRDEKALLETKECKVYFDSIEDFKDFERTLISLSQGPRSKIHKEKQLSFEFAQTEGTKVALSLGIVDITSGNPKMVVFLRGKLERFDVDGAAGTYKMRGSKQPAASAAASAASVSTATTSASVASAKAVDDVSAKEKAAKAGLSKEEQQKRLNLLSQLIEQQKTKLQNYYFFWPIKSGEECDVESLSKELGDNKYLIARKVSNGCIIAIVDGCTPATAVSLKTEGEDLLLKHLSNVCKRREMIIFIDKNKFNYYYASIDSLIKDFISKMSSEFKGKKIKLDLSNSREGDVLRNEFQRRLSNCSIANLMLEPVGQDQLRVTIVEPNSAVKDLSEEVYGVSMTGQFVRDLWAK